MEPEQNQETTQQDQNQSPKVLLEQTQQQYAKAREQYAQLQQQVASCRDFLVKCEGAMEILRSLVQAGTPAEIPAEASKNPVE